MVFIGKWISNNENTIVFIPPVLPGSGIGNLVRIHFSTQLRSPRDTRNSLAHWESHHLVLWSHYKLQTLISTILLTSSSFLHSASESSVWERQERWVWKKSRIWKFKLPTKGAHRSPRRPSSVLCVISPWAVWPPWRSTWRESGNTTCCNTVHALV